MSPHISVTVKLTLLQDAGCVAVFGPGTVIPKAALELLEKLKGVEF